MFSLKRLGRFCSFSAGRLIWLSCVHLPKISTIGQTGELWENIPFFMKTIRFHGNECLKPDSAPIPYLPAKYGARRCINGRGDVEQTNTIKTSIIVWWCFGSTIHVSVADVMSQKQHILWLRRVTVYNFCLIEISTFLVHVLVFNWTLWGITLNNSPESAVLVLCVMNTKHPTVYPSQVTTETENKSIITYTMPLMIHVWRMVTEYCVWRKILKCCVWRLILKHCAWRVISKHCARRQLDASQTQLFEIRRQAPDRRQPDAMF